MIGKRYEYSDEQIAEYSLIIGFVARWLTLRKEQGLG
jgi:hypothetical protein